MLGVAVVYLSLITAFWVACPFSGRCRFLRFAPADRQRRLALSFITIVMGGSLRAREVRVATSDAFFSC
jgi:hypothetical protein